MSTKDTTHNPFPSFGTQPYGIIKAINGTTGTLGGKPIGPATSITYDVFIWDGKAGYNLTAMKPSQPRFDCNIYPTPLSTPFPVFIVGDQVHFQVVEVPAIEACT